MLDHIRWRGWPLALIAFACILYADTFSHEFTYDDLHVVRMNEQIRDIKNLTALVSPEKYFSVSREHTFRPVVTLFYFVEAAFFGITPTGFHAVQILLHAFCGVMTAWIGLRFGLSKFHALFAAMIFLAHPVATEAVNSVGFLEDVLALFFMLVSLIFVLTNREGRPGAIAAATIFYFLAMLSKEVSILFPIAVWRIVRKEGWNTRSFRILMGSMGLGLAVYSFLRFYLFLLPPDQRSLFAPPSLPPLETVYSMACVVVNDIRLFFVPVGLSAAHVVTVQDELTWNVFLSFVVIGGFAFVFMKSALFMVRLGGLWCLLSFLPVSQIVTTAQPSTERFLYVPLFGAALAMSAAWNAQFASSRLWNRWAPAGVVLILSILTFLRNPVWHDQERLFQDALKKNPQNSFALNVLGGWAEKQGRHDAAEYYLKRALELQPDHYHYRNNLATLYFHGRRYRDAIPLLESITRTHPQDVNARIRLAWCYWLTQDQEHSRFHAALARAAGPRTPEDLKSLEELENRMKEKNTASTEKNN